MVWWFLGGVFVGFLFAVFLIAVCHVSGNAYDNDQEGDEK